MQTLDDVTSLSRAPDSRRPAAASPASFLRGRVGLAGQAEGKHQNAGCQPGHTGRSDGT